MARGDCVGVGFCKVDLLNAGGCGEFGLSNAASVPLRFFSQRADKNSFAVSDVGGGTGVVIKFPADNVGIHACAADVFSDAVDD